MRPGQKTGPDWVCWWCLLMCRFARCILGLDIHPLAKMNRSKPSAPINTPLQRGGRGCCDCTNRFNGLSSAVKTVETVWHPDRAISTPLKRGVNEICRSYGAAAGMIPNFHPQSAP